MSRKYVVIGLLMVVFAFPTQDSFVEAGCKGDKSKLRSKWKVKLRQRCQAFIDSKKNVDVREGATCFVVGFNNHIKEEKCVMGSSCFTYAQNDVDGMSIPFCESGDYSVNTKPRGSCASQKKHIRNKYKDKWKQVCNEWKKVLHGARPGHQESGCQRYMGAHYRENVYEPILQAAYERECN